MMLIMNNVMANTDNLKLYSKECASPPTFKHPHYNLFLSSNMSFVPCYLPLQENSRSLQPDFENSKPNHEFKSVAQAGQDLAILSILQDMSNGFFIDLAANHYKALSNTYLLEQFKFWKGICIEPNHMYWENILANRRCKLYVNPVSDKTGDKVKFRMSNVLGGIVGEEFDQHDKQNDTESVELETSTLTLVLDHAKAPHVIHYMSLDIEGAEFVAMSGFDFNKYKIWLLQIERPKPKLHLLLAKHGYVSVYCMTEYGDILYMHYSTPNFENIFKEKHQSNPPSWYGRKREYISFPIWSGDIHKYMEEASKHYFNLNGK